MVALNYSFNSIESLACALVLILSPPEGAGTLSTETSRSPSPLEELALIGGCDVTRRILEI